MIVKSPRVFVWVTVPLALNIALYLAFFVYGSQYADQLVTQMIARITSSLPAWLLDASRWSLKLLSWVLLATIAAVSFTILSGLLSAPFNDLLCRATRRVYQARGASHPGVSREIELRWSQSMGLELKRMLVLAMGALLAFVLGVIPFLQLPALVLAALLVAFEYFGYPISQTSPRLGSVAMFMARHPLVSLGFGTFLLLVMALPFTSVLYIPLAVIGGTELHCSLSNGESLPGERTRKRT